MGGACPSGTYKLKYVDRNDSAVVFPWVATCGPYKNGDLKNGPDSRGKKHKADSRSHSLNASRKDDRLSDMDFEFATQSTSESKSNLKSRRLKRRKSTTAMRNRSAPRAGSGLRRFASNSRRPRRVATDPSTPMLSAMDTKTHTNQHSIDDFSVCCTVGKGFLGRVRLGQFKANKKYFAIKCMSRQEIYDKKAIHFVKRELKILRTLPSLRSKFLIQMFGHWQDSHNIYILMPYAAGGELLHLIHEQETLGEDVARFYAAEIGVAINDLHNSNIVYRDLKPDNVMIDMLGHVKLVDFGFARKLSRSSTRLPFQEACGTTSYLALELVKRGESHSFAVDWWAYGCVIFEMLIGTPPFGDRNDMAKDKIIHRILAGLPHVPRTVSKEARSLIRSLLVPEADRLGWREVQEHPWFNQGGVVLNWSKAARGLLLPPMRPRLRAEGDHSYFANWKKDDRLPTVHGPPPPNRVLKYASL